jgi:CubicO group peptidase (beta-lactamase class C family)
MMNSFPPVPDTQVTLANWRTAPFNSWAFHHVAEIVPSATIHNDPAAAMRLEAADQIAMPDCSYGSEIIDFAEFSRRCTLDAMVVLHRGEVIFEQYDHGMNAQDPHILMSVSKSMLGLLAGILADKGILEIDAPAQIHVPELAETGFVGATVRDLLDMRSGITFDEDYLATEGPIIEYRKSTNWNPLGDGETPSDLRNFLLTLKDAHRPHGGNFDYISPCTDLLGWVIERATGQRYADAFSEHLLVPMQAEAPAQITVDRLGAPRCAGGMSFTARTLAQIGQLLVQDGGGVIPANWIVDIETKGDPDAWDNGSFANDFPGLSMHYRSKWYVLRNNGPILMGIGIHGQNLIVDRKAGLVMVRFCSSGTPLDLNSDQAAVSLFEAIRDKVA